MQHYCPRNGYLFNRPIKRKTSDFTGVSTCLLIKYISLEPGFSEPFSRPFRLHILPLGLESCVLLSKQGRKSDDDDDDDDDDDNDDNDDDDDGNKSE